MGDIITFHTEGKKKPTKNIVLFWLLLVFGMLFLVVIAQSLGVYLQLRNLPMAKTLKYSVLKMRVCTHVVFHCFLTHILFDTQWL